MARATFVQHARKDYPHADIKKGESYYWWKFAFSSKRYSKTAPRRSQLTQSDFLGRIYDIEDRLGNLSVEDIETARSERDDIVSELRDMASECEDKRSNMPESLQDAPSGQTLESRVDSCNEMADELENIDLDIELEEVDITKELGEKDKDFAERVESAKDDAREAYEQAVEDAINEVSGVSYSGE